LNFQTGSKTYSLCFLYNRSTMFSSMSQIWDVDMFKIQASGIYGKGCSTSIPKAYAPHT